MKKTILVILDGLNYQTAKECMGFLLSVCEYNKGKLYPITCELPSMSSPLYECILTGALPLESGIVNNHISRMSNQQSIFHLIRQAGLTTGAAAYYWISELYNRFPFNYIEDRHTKNKELAIQNGHFYFEDHYPDSHLFLDGENLRLSYNPDFLLYHSMNIDNAGHKYGLDSREYRNATRNVDIILSNFLPSWLENNYQVIITADHGMNNDLSHGGTLVEERLIPFFVFGESFSLEDAEPKQNEICGIVANIFSISHNKPICREILK